MNKMISTLTFKEKLGYGLGDTASHFVWDMVGFWLMFFYTDVFGISAIAAGTIMLIARFWDMAIDPMIGIVSDRTSTKWGKYKDDAKESKANNAIFYSDWALGEFFTSAKKSGYYDNTIFIITADHASEFTENSTNIPNLFHIPLLILGPNLKPGIDSRIGSQVDVLPTIVNLANWNTNFASMGTSLIGPIDKITSSYGALCVRDQVLNYINNDGWIAHDLLKIIGQSSSLSSLNIIQMEQDLLSLYQTTVQVQLTNRVSPPNL